MKGVDVTISYGYMCTESIDAYIGVAEAAESDNSTINVALDTPNGHGGSSNKVTSSRCGD